jgi:hypothetical protein
MWVAGMAWRSRPIIRFVFFNSTEKEEAKLGSLLFFFINFKRSILRESHKVSKGNKHIGNQS